MPVDVLAGNNVDHARDGVRAVQGRGAARQDLDALDDGRGNGLDVDDVVVAVVGLRVLRRATTIDQGQGQARSQVAQVNDLGVGGEAGDGQVAGEGCGGVLGEGLQHVADGLESFALDVCPRDHGDGCRAFQINALDARTDHGHLVEGGCLCSRGLVVLGGGLRFLGHGRAGYWNQQGGQEC